MSEPKWTPGPWETHGSLVIANRPNPNGGTICQLSEVRASKYAEHHEPDLGSANFREIFANGRLISAAPELFEALVNILDANPDFGRERFADALEKGRAALAKARGDHGDE